MLGDSFREMLTGCTGSAGFGLLSLGVMLCFSRHAMLQNIVLACPRCCRKPIKKSSLETNIGTCLADDLGFVAQGPAS